MKSFGLLIVQMVWTIALAVLVYQGLCSLGSIRNAKMVKIAAVFICLGIFADILNVIATKFSAVGDKIEKIFSIIG